jgi:hypothetical protein
MSAADDKFAHIQSQQTAREDHIMEALNASKRTFTSSVISGLLLRFRQVQSLSLLIGKPLLICGFEAVQIGLPEGLLRGIFQPLHFSQLLVLIILQCFYLEAAVNLSMVAARVYLKSLSFISLERKVDPANVVVQLVLFHTNTHLLLCQAGYSH